MKQCYTTNSKNSNNAKVKNINNHSQIFFKIGAFRNFAIFTGKHLFFVEKRIQRRYVPVNIAKYLGTAFFLIEYISKGIF